MKKLLLFLLFGTIAIGLRADEKVVPLSRRQKITSALTSKPAKIIYGILGIAVGAGSIHLYKEGKRLALILDERIDKYLFMPGLFTQECGLTNGEIKYISESTKQDYQFNTISITASPEEQETLWRLAREGQHASWFTKNKIKVTPVVKGKDVSVRFEISSKRKDQ